MGSGFWLQGLKVGFTVQDSGLGCQLRARVGAAKNTAAARPTSCSETLNPSLPNTQHSPGPKAPTPEVEVHPEPPPKPETPKP